MNEDGPILLQPECRYGHGSLVRVNDERLGSTFMLVTLAPMEVIRGQSALPTGYAVNVWRCPTCTYLELHEVTKEPYHGHDPA